jgi:uncharacterized protein
MDSADETRRVVQELLGRIAMGSPEKIGELFADTVDWQLDWPAAGHPAAPWIRPRSTRAEVVEHFEALRQFHVPEQNASSVSKILVDGSDAVVLGWIRQTVRASGRAYVAAFALHVTVEEGLVRRFHVYEDSLTVANAFA